jgi:antitoxin HicB
MPQKTYTVSDGELVLTLEVLPENDGGGYGVTSPLEPQLVTEAKTIEDAFAMARDAIEALRESRRNCGISRGGGPVKRGKLEQHLRDHGCHFSHHGGKHDIWINPGQARTL